VYEIVDEGLVKEGKTPRNKAQLSRKLEAGQKLLTHFTARE